MKRTVMAIALASLLSVTATVATAGDHRHERRHEVRDRDWDDRHAHRHEKRADRYHEKWDDRRYRDQRAWDHDHDRRWDGRGDWNHSHWEHRPRYRVGHYHAPHGYRPHHWRRGDRLPVAYCAPRYIVHDYYVYDLPRPPRGYRYVRVDNDVVLAAIASGIVSQVVFGMFY
jgi:Ni/Co efflux regulator RcnB